MALALAGCSSPGTSPSSQAPSTTAPTTSAAPSTTAPAEPIKLTFQALYDQPGNIAACKAIVDAWNKANPLIQVEYIAAGWDSINNKLVTQFNGGTAPDIIHNEVAAMVSFAADGYLADLTPYMSDAMKADIGQGLLDSVTLDGKIYQYPTELQAYTAFANTKILRDAGVTIPTGDTLSWDDFQAMAKAATKEGVFGFGWGLKSPTAAFMTMAPGFGATYFSGTGADVKINVGANELALPQIAYKMAYEDKSLMPVTLTQSGSEVMAAFYAGQIAMTIQGSYQAANIPKNAPDGFEWTVLPPLAGPAGANQAADPQTLSVNADSKHIKEAAQFIEYFMSPENLAAINTADALIPTTASARAAMASSLGAQGHWDMIMKAGDHFVSGPFLYANNYQSWKDTVATPSFQQYLGKKIDAAGLAKALTDGWNSLG